MNPDPQRCRLARCLRGLLILVILSAGGCSMVRQAAFPALETPLPTRQILESVPFYPQTQYQCGPASLAMALSWSGVDVAPEDLTQSVYTPSLQGSLQMALIGATRRYGRLAFEISSARELITEVAAGNPVIVLQNLGVSRLPLWHYAVVIGYDSQHRQIFLHSGTRRALTTDYGMFLESWSDGDFWGMLALPPGQVPASAHEGGYLKAVYGLEQAGQYQAALAGYRRALDRWPESWTARMGIGNTWYAMGELAEAEGAFREAVRQNPDGASGYNNLAQVLFETGRRKEALKMAREAVRLGGPLADLYRQTLEQIEAAGSQSIHR